MIANWLEDLHKEFIRGVPQNPGSLKQVQISYAQVLAWMGEEHPEFPLLQDQKRWIEFLADRFHYHKYKSGIGVAEHNLLPKVETGDQEANSCWESKLTYSVALDNLRSAFNVGSIFRQVDAVGFESVIIGGKTPGKENLQVQKTSMGCTEWIPQVELSDLSQGLQNYKEQGYQLIGIETIKESNNHFEFQWPKKGIIVLGNEEYGLTQDMLAACDCFVHLPMFGKKNSINVANAFSAVSYQVVKTFLL